MEKIKQAIQKKFLNADGTLNKTVIASFITLLIVLLQQILFAFGISYGGWDQVVAIINTVLTLLGLCGFVEGNGEVTVGGERHEEVSAPEAKPDSTTGTQGK